MLIPGDAAMAASAALIAAWEGCGSAPGSFDGVREAAISRPGDRRSEILCKRPLKSFEFGL